MIITTWIWANLFYGYCFWEKYTTPLRILACLLLSILSIPIDAILLPLELIVLLIYSIIGLDDKEE